MFSRKLFYKITSGDASDRKHRNFPLSAVQLDSLEGILKSLFWGGYTTIEFCRHFNHKTKPNLIHLAFMNWNFHWCFKKDSNQRDVIWTFPQWLEFSLSVLNSYFWGLLFTDWNRWQSHKVLTDSSKTLIKQSPLDRAKKLNVRKTFRIRLHFFWTSYIRSLYVLCPGGFLVRKNWVQVVFTPLRNISRSLIHSQYLIHTLKILHHLLHDFCCFKPADESTDQWNGTI